MDFSSDSCMSQDHQPTNTIDNSIMINGTSSDRKIKDGKIVLYIAYYVYVFLFS